MARTFRIDLGDFDNDELVDACMAFAFACKPASGLVGASTALLPCNSLPACRPDAAHRMLVTAAGHGVDPRLVAQAMLTCPGLGVAMFEHVKVLALLEKTEIIGDLRAKYGPQLDLVTFYLRPMRSSLARMSRVMAAANLPLAPVPFDAPRSEVGQRRDLLHKLRLPLAAVIGFVRGFRADLGARDQLFFAYFVSCAAVYLRKVQRASPGVVPSVFRALHVLIGASGFSKQADRIHGVIKAAEDKMIARLRLMPRQKRKSKKQRRAAPDTQEEEDEKKQQHKSSAAKRRAHDRSGGLRHEDRANQYLGRSLRPDETMVCGWSYTLDDTKEGAGEVDAHDPVPPRLHHLVRAQAEALVEAV